MKKGSTFLPDLPYLKCLLYGRTGIGKTTLLGTAPNPFIIATEDGMLSLASQKIDYALVTSTDQIRKLYLELSKSEYETICIDSLTALSDMILGEVEKETGTEEAITTYPLVRTKLIKTINAWLGIPKHIIMTATETRSDNHKPVLPSVIGSKLCEDLGRFFNHVQFMDFGKDGEVIIHLSRHKYSVAKDRTGEIGKSAKYHAGFYEDLISLIHGSPKSKSEQRKNPPDPKTKPTAEVTTKETPTPQPSESSEKDVSGKDENEVEEPFEFDL